MKDYLNFSTEDFVMDENFQEWVKYPTAENNKWWENWLKQHPHKIKEVEQARIIILSLDFKKTQERDIPKNLILNRIQHTIQEINQKERYYHYNSSKYFFKAAAVFIGLIISVATLYILLNPSYEDYATTYGELKNLHLPDGSEMVLNANSSIRFKNKWGSSEYRKVWLEGEAFFLIDHKINSQKFQVITKQLSVEVIGTEFNVNTRRSSTKVVLNTGKVKLKDGLIEGEILMDPGEYIELSGPNKQITKKVVNPELFSSWRKNQLVFKATPLLEIAEVLEDNYGLKITFEEEEIKTYQFTGAVSTESKENIKLLLFTISEAFNLEIKSEKNLLIFQHKK
jgi:transmembrane sensor